MIICWERADLLARLCVVFSCVFVTFPYDVPGQVWYLIPDLCLTLYFANALVWGNLEKLIFVRFEANPKFLCFAK